MKNKMQVYFNNGRAFVWEKGKRKGKNYFKRKYGRIIICYQCKGEYFITNTNYARNKKDIELCPLCFKLFHQIENANVIIEKLTIKFNERRQTNADKNNSK